MTKIQRQKHIEALNDILTQAGATIDRWGQYHIREYKFDTRETNLKVYKGKIKVKSTPMVNITLEEFKNYIDARINK